MEEVIEFCYQDTVYTGSLLSSKDMTPQYHWLLLRQPEMQKILGEELAFVVKENSLRPINTFLAHKNKELFQQIQAAMEKHLSKS